MNYSLANSTVSYFARTIAHTVGMYSCQCNKPAMWQALNALSEDMV